MGKDKIFLHLHDNETFLGKLYREATLFFEKVIISAGSEEHAEKIRQLLPAAEIVPDQYSEKGPMGGIVSVYERSGTECFAVVPADVPKADMAVLSFFYDQCETNAVVLRNGDKLEPLIGAYGKSVLQKMKQLVNEGNYRIRLAFGENTKYYSCTDLAARFSDKTELELENAFRNINTEQEYKELIK